MNGRLRFTLPLLLIFICLSILIIFRVRTVNPLWDGWRVLAVESLVSEQQVLAELQNAGVGTIVSASSKKAADFPNYVIESIYGTQFSPLLKNEKNNYVSNLDAYFYDSARSWRLYYLLNNPASLKKVEQVMQTIGARWGIDEQSVPPLVPSLLCAAASAVLFYFAKKRVIFVCAQLPFLLLIFFSPSAAVCAAVCFTGFASFCLQLVWGKPRYFILLKKNVFFIFVCVSALVLAATGGFFFFFLFICATLCSLAIIYEYNLVFSYLKTFRRFNPIVIRPARKQDFSGRRLLRLFLVSAAAALCVLPVFALFARFLPSSGIAGLSIPAPVRYTKSGVFDIQGYSDVKKLKSPNSLPALDDYVLFCWNSAVFPYVRLQEKRGEPKPGDRVEFQRYKKSPDGGISVSNEEVLVFDSAFIGRLLNGLDKLEVPAIESVFRSQRGFFTAGYTGTSKTASRAAGSLPISVIIILLLLTSAGFFLYKADKWLN